MRKNATLKDRVSPLTTTITISNKIAILRYHTYNDYQKIAFKLWDSTVKDILDVCQHFNAGTSMTIGKKIYKEFSRSQGLVGYIYGKAIDEFGLPIEQKIPIETLILDGYYTSQGILLNVRVGADGHSFTVQYELNLFRQGSAVREITRELLHYTK